MFLGAINDFGVHNFLFVNHPFGNNIHIFVFVVLVFEKKTQAADSPFQRGTKKASCFEFCVFKRSDPQKVGGGPPPFVTGFEGTVACQKNVSL